MPVGAGARISPNLSGFIRTAGLGTPSPSAPVVGIIKDVDKVTEDEAKSEELWSNLYRHLGDCVLEYQTGKVFIHGQRRSSDPEGQPTTPKLGFTAFLELLCRKPSHVHLGLLCTRKPCTLPHGPVDLSSMISHFQRFGAERAIVTGCALTEQFFEWAKRQGVQFKGSSLAELDNDGEAASRV